MICHRYKCIFIHQRKTAGQSIMRSFGLDSGRPEWHMFNGGLSAREPGWEAKARLYDDYLVFAVVRNPWDRFVSGWSYLKSTRRRSLLDVLREPPREGHDYNHLTRPQHAILFDAEGRLVADHLIRFERLQEGFDAVCDRIGRPRTTLPHVNATPHAHYREHFTDAQTRRLFDDRFGADVRTLGYAFDGSFSPAELNASTLRLDSSPSAASALSRRSCRPAACHRARSPTRARRRR